MADLLSTLSGQPTNFEVGAPEPTDPANIANALAVYHYGPSLAGDGMDHHLDVLTASVSYAISNGGGTAAQPETLGAVYGRTEGIDGTNAGIGYRALFSNTTGFENIAIGLSSLYYNTGGHYNVAAGRSSLFRNTTGGKNVAIGSFTLQANTSGSGNISIGHQSMYNNVTGLNNVAVGISALGNNTTSGNVGIGHYALMSNSTGHYNVAIGAHALQTGAGGVSNVAVGAFALYNNGIGTDNTALGYQALNTNTTGVNNTAIGSGAVAATATSVNSITLGNSSIATLRCQVTTITALSDERDKTNIESIPVGLEFIESLRPVKFDWNMRDGAKVGVPDIGFIAQDLVAVEDALDANDWLQLTYRDNPEKLEATYGRLVPILVKAVQELSAEVKELKSRMV